MDSAIKKGDLVSWEGRDGIVVKEFQMNALGYGKLEVLFFDENEFLCIYNTRLASRKHTTETTKNSAVALLKDYCDKYQLTSRGKVLIKLFAEWLDEQPCPDKE